MNPREFKDEILLCKNDYPVLSMTSGLTVEYLITQGKERIENTCPPVIAREGQVENQKRDPYEKISIEL
jgi:hypothetical protein